MATASVGRLGPRSAVCGECRILLGPQESCPTSADHSKRSLVRLAETDRELRRHRLRWSVVLGRVVGAPLLLSPLFWLGMLFWLEESRAGVSWPPWAILLFIASPFALPALGTLLVSRLGPLRRWALHGSDVLDEPRTGDVVAAGTARGKATVSVPFGSRYCLAFELQVKKRGGLGGALLFRSLRAVPFEIATDDGEIAVDAERVRLTGEWERCSGHALYEIEKWYREALEVEDSADLEAWILVVRPGDAVRLRSSVEREVEPSAYRDEVQRVATGLPTLELTPDAALPKVRP